MGEDLQLDQQQAKDKKQEKYFAVACYLPLVNFFIAIISSVKFVKSSYSLLHARQGLIILGLTFITIIVGMISKRIGLMLWGVTLLLHIWGGILAWQEKEEKIPVIGSLAMMIPPYFLYRLLTGNEYNDRA